MARYEEGASFAKLFADLRCSKPTHERGSVLLCAWLASEARGQAASALSWTCGHEAGAACAQCYMELARKAHELATEVVRLRELLGARGVSQ